jgi:CDP-diacylglycerol pyrophosphatase
MQKLIYGFIFLSIVGLFEGCASKVVRSDILWNIVSTQCVPGQKANAEPAPCSEVHLQGKDDIGYVIMKDRRGPLQYLLLPSNKVTGIESPFVLDAQAPNYFEKAWEGRSYMEKKFGSPIAREEVSLAVNSVEGRSQNQLHVHISCVGLETKKVITAQLSHIGAKWTPIPGGLYGHAYQARRITEKELADVGAFQLLANDLPGAKTNMGSYGLGLVALPKKDFVLLADKVDKSVKDDASVEEIQDHDCPQLYKK